MEIAPFALERYFAENEPSSRYFLSSSDCEPLAMSELLGTADEETTRLWEDLKLGYTTYEGHPLLREAIAEMYKGIEAGDTLVLAPEEGIFLLMHALLRPGDHTICTFPGYQSLYEVARSIGCDVSTWEPHEEKGWHFDVEELEEKIRANTKLIVVNFPHNPTGYVPPRKDFEAIVHLAQKHQVYLFSDEMYRLPEIEEGATLPSACEMYERAFALSGLSKLFGLPGLRMGWLASPESKALKRVNELKDYTTICCSAPSEILAIMALRGKSVIIREQSARVNRNVKELERFFVEYGDCFRWNRPKGGSVCFPRMTVVEDTSVFCEELAEATGILVAPSRRFQFGNRHVRIGFGREDLPQVIERFAAYLELRFR
jgi:aspartate/methionine/tyrosine aminotransferase